MSLFYKLVILPTYRMSLGQRDRAKAKGDEYMEIAESLREKARELMVSDEKISQNLFKEAMKYAKQAEKSFIETAKISAELARTEIDYPAVKSDAVQQ